MIHFLSIQGLARTLIWIVLIYFIVKILTRLFAPFLLKYAANKVEKTFGQQFNQHQAQQKPKGKEGETVIDKMPTKNSSSNKKVGEYIDYEEID